MPETELGTFPRARREAVQPANVGLLAGQRRRTPGLRRAELATLAGISVEYLIRLEQGRDRHPSMQVLATLANALQLSAGDRELLVRAAKAAGGNACPAQVSPPAWRVRQSVRLVLDRLEPTPAVVLNRLTDVLAHTSGYERLVRRLGILDSSTPNLARFAFADSRAASVYPDWDELADELVTNLTFDAKPEDTHLAALAGELDVLAGHAFTSRLAAPPRAPRRHGIQRMDHPEVGQLRLSFETLALPDDDQRLVIYLPADDASSVSLDQLGAPTPGGLRVVPTERASIVR
jgi:transcriptional regulator with XRE-family HTH domain